MKTKVLLGAFLLLITATVGGAVLTHLNGQRAGTQTIVQIDKKDALEELQKGLDLEVGKRYTFVLAENPVMIKGTLQEFRAYDWLKIRREVDKQVREDITWIRVNKIVYIQELSAPRTP